MKEKIKKWWGILPLIVAIGLAMASSSWSSQGMALRNGPAVAYLFCDAGAIVLFLYWFIRFSSDWSKMLNGFAKNLMVLAGGVLAIFAIITGVYALISYANVNQPEYVVTKNGINMIASVDNSDGTYVYYYEDKGGNFRGAELLGEEYYGEEKFDPFETDDEETAESGIFYDLEGTVVEQWGDKYEE